MKVISILLNNFKNDSRVLKENISLQKAGYDIQVVALHDKDLPERETKENIPVHRIILKSKNWSKMSLIQMVKYLEFVFRFIKAYRKNSVFHCNDLEALPIGVIIKVFFNRNAKIVYDAHEYETELNGLHGIKKVLSKILEKSLIRFADKVITVSNTIANEYVRLYGIEKPALVLNSPFYQELKPKNIFREKFNIPMDKKIFLYQGGLMQGRGIEILIDVFKEEGFKDSMLVFMGYGPLEKLISEESKNSSNIFYHEAVSPEIILNYTSSADYGIALIQDISLSDRYCLPNKLFEYLLAGLPVVVSNLPEMKKFVNTHEVGKVSTNISKDGLIGAINLIQKEDYNNLKDNVYKIQKQYSWDEQEKVLIDVYDSINAKRLIK